MQPLAQPDLRDRPKNLRPVSDTGLPADPPIPQVQGGSSSEERGDYRSVVAVLNADWRVIACGAGIQWILQRRRGHRGGDERWQGHSYCRSRAGLLFCVWDYCGAIDPAAMSTLRLLLDRIETTR